jgi:AcrR family transcriptional regulator
MSIDDAQHRVLAAADELFYGEGIAAVTMADVRDRSGVSLRRLYSLYPTKKDLVAGWLSDRHDTWMRWFTSSVDRHIAKGTDPLLAVFDAVEEWINSPTYRGCGFINSIAETSEIDERHRAVIAAHKRDLINHIASLATRNRRKGPKWLPAALAVILDGVFVQCAIFSGTEPLKAARRAVVQLIESTRTESKLSSDTAQPLKSQ